MKTLPSQLTLLSAVAYMTCAHAAGMTQGSVIRDYTDVVAPAEQQAYEAGEKALNKCFGCGGSGARTSGQPHSPSG
jgi:hypothetical protein